MGTRYTAIFHAPASSDLAAIEAELFAAVDAIDRQMSSWNPASDLCRLNAAPEGVWVTIPEALARVLATGLQVGRDSNGAFDMAIGEVVEAWGFGPSRLTPMRTPLPDARVGKARGTAATLIDLDGPALRVRKLGPATMDLSGIAKGEGVDALARCLDERRIDNWLVGIDGEMRARGTRGDGSAWAVGIERPTFGRREVGAVMELRDTAIATSGDYRRWVDVDGKRHSHTMDPATRRPVANRIASVTVLAPACILADAWATALMVLGEHEGIALARARGIDALFVLRDRDRLVEVLVPGQALAPGGAQDPALPWPEGERAQVKDGGPSALRE
ncbi:MAG: FAD:protein FMN transferase [Burkholderiales bacterium]|nr:FAD:protein FMN transferase [Burkholderiales bacterium]